MSTKNGTNQARTSRDVGSELIYLTKALKAPALRDAAARLAERARDEGWSHEEYLAACLQREVAARDSHGAEVISLKGDSYRMRGRDLGRVPAANTGE
ncbi:P-loop NTPase family protein [Streptomyces lycii]|uniref:Transposase n=1 Tax=Streptomyces lycii TaxID=2654337 RepID=A0ABQ7FC66_9ACTN|nr:hypothetical protein [Streptomyces lycii]KAF4405929.1 hypothetical protein GCU69_27675 [Streptomyces lycii]